MPWCCSVGASQQLCDHAVVASPRRNETDIGQNCSRLGSQAELFPMLVVGSHLGSIWNHQLSEFDMHVSFIHAMKMCIGLVREEY